MTPRAIELFNDLADLSPTERDSYLANHPSGDKTRADVQDLLGYDDEADDPLSPVIAAAASYTIQQMDAVGARCGAFQLTSVIGRGGMGVVYLADRVDGEIRQRAAVKLLHPGWTHAHRQRFLHEREILAALSHPNIAHLLDAGRLPDGQPYLAMEYVAGETINRYCQGLPARQKIELFIKVCAAVDYLHNNHLVHRDLKPGNILVTPEGEPKLLDFGISKLLDMSGDVTATCFRMLTPNYASPEQIHGEPVGKASDIYSLGVMLRELLGASVKGDLAVIVRAATRREPEERYASAEQLAADLRAVLDSNPIRARRGEWLYRTRKLVARHAFVIAASALAAATVVTAAAALWPRRPAPSDTLIAQRLTANTTELPVSGAAFSPDGKSVAYSDALGIHVRDTATSATRLLPETAGAVVTHWKADAAGLKYTPSTDSWSPSPDGKRQASSPPGSSSILVQNADGSGAREIWKAADGRTLNDFAWSPGGQEIAAISSRGTVSALEVIDVLRGRKSVLIADTRKLSMGGVTWAGPDRIFLSTFERTGVNAYNSNLWEARLNTRRQLVSGSLRQRTAWTDFPIQPGSLTSDGRRLVFVRNSTQRDVYVAAVDRAHLRIDAPRRLTLDLGDDSPNAWTPDSSSVIMASERAGETKIFRQDLDRQVAEPLADQPGRQLYARMAPDNKSVLFCSVIPKDTTCRLMRAPLSGGKPELVAVIPQFADFRCSPSGHCFVTQRTGRTPGDTVSELDLEKGIGRQIYQDKDNFSGMADLSPDGTELATVNRNRIIVRSFATGATLREIQVQGVAQLFTIDYAPDGKGFYTGDFRQTEARQLYVDRSGKATLLWKQPGRSLIRGIPSPDGKNLAMLMYTTDANVYMVDAL